MRIVCDYWHTCVHAHGPTQTLEVGDGGMTLNGSSLQTLHSPLSSTILFPPLLSPIINPYLHSFPDPDMLEVGNGGMTTAEYRVHFSLWALMKVRDVAFHCCECHSVVGDGAITAHTGMLTESEDMSLNPRAVKVKPLPCIWKEWPTERLPPGECLEHICLLVHALLPQSYKPIICSGLLFVSHSCTADALADDWLQCWQYQLGTMTKCPMQF